MITEEDINAFDFGVEVDMDEYQKKARKFAIYDTRYKVVYPTLGLTSEAGEVSDKIKKWLRDGDANKEEIAKELGDVLWYAAVLAEDLGFTLSEVATMNLEKLGNRKKRGKLRGSGDNR